jgi:hypothetical protein
LLVSWHLSVAGAKQQIARERYSQAKRNKRFFRFEIGHGMTHSYTSELKGKTIDAEAAAAIVKSGDWIALLSLGIRAERACSKRSNWPTPKP